jgi:cardiolipin synthase
VPNLDLDVHAASVLLLSIIHVAGVLAAAHSVFQVRTPQGTIAWIIALTFVPWIALPAYLVLGRHRLGAYERRLRSHDAAHRDRAEGETVLERIALSPFRSGARLDLLIDGRATFDAIFEAIGEAEQSVCVAFYTIRDDGIGGALAEELIGAAGRGVEVRVLYDDVGSGSDIDRYARRLAEAGVRVCAFGARAGWAGRLGFNFRNHRKIVVVDGKVAFIGGLNVGDEYLGEDPRLSPWRDTHLRIEGPAVADVQSTWLLDWTWASGDAPALPVHVDPVGDDDALVFATGPLAEHPALGLGFAALFADARSRLWITSPYFVPTPGVDLALRLAAKRGVDVRVLLPRASDHLLSTLAALVCLKDHADSGVRFFRSSSGFMHQKVVLVDDHTSMIGSANLDYRSIALNFELGAVVRSGAFAARVEDMLSRDFEAGSQIDHCEYDELPPWRKLAARLSWLMAPLL